MIELLTDRDDHNTLTLFNKYLKCLTVWWFFQIRAVKTVFSTGPANNECMINTIVTLDIRRDRPA